VSSEKEQGASPSYVIVESLLGTECHVTNPWPVQEVIVERVAFPSVPVAASMAQGVLDFPIARETKHMLRPKEALNGNVTTHFTGEAW
jgi:hypothetical protein